MDHYFPTVLGLHLQVIAKVILIFPSLQWYYFTNDLIRTMQGSTSNTVHTPQPFRARIKCPGCSEGDEILNGCHSFYLFLGDDFRQLRHFKRKQPINCNQHPAQKVETAAQHNHRK